MQLLTPQLGLIFWTAVIFLTLLFLLKKYAWGPILKGLDEREKTIHDSLSQADAIKKEMAAMKSEHHQLLMDAKQQQIQILREAKEAAEKIQTEAREKAKAEQNKIVEDARREIDNQKMAAITDMKNQMGKLVTEVSEKVLSRELNNKDSQQEYIQQLIKDSKLN
jgi:F-type H+-transporting ATPase subunit b